MALRIKSAIKKNRQSIKKRARNNFVRSTLKTKLKSFYSALEEKDKDKSNQKLREIISALDKAATKGVIHKRNAARRVARLSKKVHNLS